MKIGLIGYGKMGKAIEKIALSQGITVVWTLGRDHNAPDALLQQADVAIEFTRPDAAYDNVMRCLRAGVPVVCGTTGWNEQRAAAATFCAANGGAMLWASNFSVGVNLFFALNGFLARLMSAQTDYQASATEIHHIHKLDAPSGTAVSLLERICTEAGRYKGWALAPASAQAGEIPVQAIREAEVPGTHIVRWESPIDEISIEHKAHSREGFARGAVLAAQWLKGKTGVFGMGDVLGI